MARLRYVKNAEELAAAERPQAYESHIKSLRGLYETDPGIPEALLPAPLVAAPQPLVEVAFSEVSIQVQPGFNIDIGSMIFGVRATYEGVEGTYLITMVMTAEGAVVQGRERYGEPKKLGEVTLKRDGDQVSASVSRQGMTYIEASGTLGADQGAREYTQHCYCFKVLPSCEPGKDFDVDPLLTRLKWEQSHEFVHAVDGKVTLEDSMLDPVADLPIRKLVSLEYDEGTALSSGEVLGPVPGDNLKAFLHQRYDDPFTVGIEV